MISDDGAEGKDTLQLQQSRWFQLAVWRNGSASDYESGGCSFEYYLGHLFLFPAVVSGFGPRHPLFVPSFTFRLVCSSAPRRGQ